MNKIYLVEFYRGDYDTAEVYSYCRSYGIAEEQKQELLNKVDGVKVLYNLEFGSDFEKDLRIITGYEEENLNEGEWNRVQGRVFLYLCKHPKLNFKDIKIIEKELL